jgi:hypothetical protein
MNLVKIPGTDIWVNPAHVVGVIRQGDATQVMMTYMDMDDIVTTCSLAVVVTAINGGGTQHV